MPESLPRTRHRLGDRAHAADRVSPDALPAVGLAEAVVQQHVGGACGVGTGVGSDDSVEAQNRLDRIAFEPLIEKIAGRTSERLHEIALPFESEPAQAVGDPRRIDEFAEAGGEAAAGEEAYRLIIDELPQPKRQGRTVNFVARHALPLFFDSQDGSAPQASWRVTQKGRVVSLTATNEGDRRIRLSGVKIDSGAKTVSFGPGLV